MPFYFRKECPLNSGYLNERTSKARIIHQIQLIRGITLPGSLQGKISSDGCA
ncbi:hypothetical protein [Shigella dysenteriae]|uniref:hypothetical protein n=1 Tax=Shigella dysenteriae TaxID=622 RepID=UPI0001E6B1BD|nr:hypothetical protein [Shigella dysenteriae]EFP69581.1 hypothetical protein SD1617_4730 [Shigella dysenteriae 1617]WNT50842.1 hypothetical protein PWP84_22135 [Shigella dysenteriae]